MGLNFSEYRERLNGELFFYGNASHGLYDVLVWLQEKRPKSDPNVVMPIFIPAKLYRTVLAAGYKIRFYDVSPDCGFDEVSVKNLIDDQTQAVFCIHYFGIPSPVHKLKRYTDINNVFLIEDCAHTWDSQWKGRELGNIGDCAIFSGRKMLQLPAGGFLTLNKKPWKFTPSYNKRVRSIFTACKLSRQRCKYLYYNLTRGYDPLSLAWIPSTGYIRFSEDHQITTKQISWLNKLYIQSIDLKKVVNKRRENYEFVYNKIRDIASIEPISKYSEQDNLFCKTGSLYRLHKGITPYSLPILTPLGSRKSIRGLLCDKGIGCGAGWPEAPFGISGFPQSAEFSRRLLELPIHQGMSKFQLERMIEALRFYDSQIHSEETLDSKKKINSKAEVA